MTELSHFPAVVRQTQSLVDRLLSDADGPAAHLLCQDAAGRRITL